MLKIEKCFRIVTTLVFIMATLLIPVLLLTAATLIVDGPSKSVPLGIFGTTFEILCAVNFTLAFIVLVWQTRTTKRTSLIVASSFFLASTILPLVISISSYIFWPVYLIAVILVHSKGPTKPFTNK